MKTTINSVTSSLYKSESLSFLTTASYVITLNYTNTYEQMYAGTEPTDHIVHYHGSVDCKNIVWGIDAAEEDEYTEGRVPSTDFIKFKKYYQRMLYESDSEYIKWIKHFQYFDKKYGGNPFYELSTAGNSLAVIGHSLDIADAEIIRDLFELCTDSITIYYHNEKDRASYIKKLIRIFGKSKLEEMRITRDFKFLKLPEYRIANEVI